MNKQLFILLFLALAAFGQQERIAIINTMDDRDSISVSELTYLTDRLRETAVNVLPKSRFGIMTTESIVAFLGSQERAVKTCREASCLAELGRMVSADYVAQGRIGRFSGNLTIKVELYDTKKGNLIGSFTGNSKDIFNLLALIDEKAPDLFKKMLTNDPPPPAKAAAAPAPVPAPPVPVKQPEPVKPPEPAKQPEPVKQDIVKQPEPVKPEFMKLEFDNSEFEKMEAAKKGLEKPKDESSIKTSFWVALGLDLVGAAIIFAGYQKDKELNDAYGAYYLGGQSRGYYDRTWDEVENTLNSRNKFYAIGGLFLLSGIGVHIWF